MSFNRLLRQLKRQLRGKRRWLSLGIVLLLVGTSALVFAMLQPQKEGKALEAISVWSRLKGVPGYETASAEQQKVLQQIQDGGQHRNMTAVKVYLCGEETLQIGLTSPADILRYHDEHPAAEISLDPNGGVTFTEHIDDLSPKCKENTYFGLDKSGNLSLFTGVPGNDQVIRTFFQLNIQRMKSSLPQDMVDQLYQGIRVHDLAEYNSVLSTFSEFALADMEQPEQPVTKPVG